MVRKCPNCTSLYPPLRMSAINMHILPDEGPLRILPLAPRYNVSAIQYLETYTGAYRETLKVVGGRLRWGEN